MTDRPSSDLERPETIRNAADERMDGRPTGEQPDGLRPAAAQPDVPTVAPEEEGATPTTEHAPGSDL
jgi:hypothetical protein